MRERNGSGYFDPTADAAIYKADRKPQRVVRVWRAPEDKPEEKPRVSVEEIQHMPPDMAELALGGGRPVSRHSPWR